jgi:hypothetical protein
MYGNATPDVARAEIGRVFRVSAIRRVACQHIATSKFFHPHNSLIFEALLGVESPAMPPPRTPPSIMCRFGLVLINQVPIQVTAI